MDFSFAGFAAPVCTLEQLASLPRDRVAVKALQNGEHLNAVSFQFHDHGLDVIICFCVSVDFVDQCYDGSSNRPKCMDCMH
jgi:hypothetical protein